MSETEVLADETPDKTPQVEESSSPENAASKKEEEQEKERQEEVVDKATTESSSHPEEITYEIVDEPKYPPTRALFVGNLTSPFDNSQLQGMLEDTVKDSGSFIERAWLNRNRTHSIALVSDIEGAKLLRKELNGRVFPIVENEQERETEVDEDGNEVVRKQLFIDFIPVKIVQTWIHQEDDGPIDALWKVDYETIRGRVIAQHKMINYSNVSQKSSNFLIDKRGRDHDSRSHRGFRYRSRGYGRGDYGGYPRSRSYYDDYYGGRSRSGYNRPTTDRAFSSSSHYVPGRETEERNGSSRSIDSYESESYRGRDRRDNDRGGYYSNRNGYYDSYYRGGRENYPPRYSRRGDRSRIGGYRSERPGRVERGRQEDNASREEISKADDRERSRSPVRPSEMEWDLEEDN